MWTVYEFRDRLNEELTSRLTVNHAILAELGKPVKNMPLMKSMATQGYQLTKVFARYIGGLYFNCPIDRFARRLAINLYEEETGRVSKTDSHLKLMQNFVYALGITPEELDAVEPTPETAELINYRMNLVRDPQQFHKGAAAVMIASEGQSLEKKAGKMRHQMFPEVYGLTEKDLLFFSVHAAEDVGHVQEGINLVSAICTTEKTQREALEAIHQTCARFKGFYDGVERLYRSQAAGVA